MRTMMNEKSELDIIYIMKVSVRAAYKALM